MVLLVIVILKHLMMVFKLDDQNIKVFAERDPAKITMGKNWC